MTSIEWHHHRFMRYSWPLDPSYCNDGISYPAVTITTVFITVALVWLALWDQTTSCRLNIYYTFNINVSILLLRIRPIRKLHVMISQLDMQFDGSCKLWYFSRQGLVVTFSSWYRPDVEWMYQLYTTLQLLLRWTGKPTNIFIAPSFTP